VGSLSIIVGKGPGSDLYQKNYLLFVPLRILEQEDYQVLKELLAGQEE
jgi:hypothetical protein